MRLLLVGLIGAAPLAAQSHSHMTPTAPAPAEAGQAAFAAVAAVVRILDADTATDWSRVNLEALRQHLIDMDEVTLRSEVRATPVEGGAAFEVTGAGRTLEAVRRMLAAHAPALDGEPAFRASSDVIEGGARLTVTARRPEDLVSVQRIRGLGFIGLLTIGAHHAAHHVALARGAQGGHAH